jgi:hypothetical protein
MCKKCGASSAALSDNYEEADCQQEAIAAWNRRVDAMPVVRGEWLVTDAYPHRAQRKQGEQVTDCVYKDKEEGWCKLRCDWSEPMPYIEYCVEGPCPDEKLADNPELGGNT